MSIDLRAIAIAAIGAAIAVLAYRLMFPPEGTAEKVTAPAPAASSAAPRP